MEAVPTAAEVSLCMIVKNEEAIIGQLLTYLRPWVREIIIVDTGSTDDTVYIALKCEADHTLHADISAGFGHVRNLGLAAASSEWILVVDADEWPSYPLLHWIRDFVDSSACQGVDAVRLWRESRIDGQLIHFGSAYEPHVRLFRKHLRFDGRLHEQVLPNSNQVVTEAPREYLLYHWKTQARQDCQNKFYDEYMNQPVGR